jgi:hypothetical protein
MTKRRKSDWGQLGPAMRALPHERWRTFVYEYCATAPARGAQVGAYRAAGMGLRSSPATAAKNAWNLAQDERIIAAIAEVTRNMIKAGSPEVTNALFNLIRDPTHKDHGRAIEMALGRSHPVETRSHHSVDVVHKVEDLDREALEELRALRQIGTPREKLLELYGPNGLDRIEALEARRAKVIEGEYEVIDGQG